MTKPTVGFIGLGIMGRPMSGHLIKAGYPLTVHDINRKPVAELVAEGAQEARTPREVAGASDIIITMLPDSPDVEVVALGPNGLIEGVRAGQFFVDMSTIAPSVAISVAEKLGAKGVRCLDAPVSGGDVGAQNATLSIMVGGDEATFTEIMPIFETLGQTVTLCGGNGAGQTVKACNQIQVALNLVGMAEALALGAKAGVDPAIIVRVLSGGYAQTRVMDVRGPRVIRGDFSPGFKSKFHYKDLNIIMQTGKDYEVPLPVTAVTRELFGVMLAAGRGDLDHSGILTVLEDLARVEARMTQLDNRERESQT
jgi:2-hydroxy-3-oxopropionate reductase